MPQTQNKRSKYPKEFEMYTNEGNELRVTVDESRFCAERELSVDDIFGKCEYWPESVVWTGSAENLGELLKQLAEAHRVNQKELLATIVSYFKSEGFREITDCLEGEKKAARKKEAVPNFWRRWSTLQGEHRIPMIPSPGWGRNTCYDGLDLVLDRQGWKATLYSDANGAGGLPDLLTPERWESGTFDGLFEVKNAWGQLLGDMGWFDDRDELAELLIEDDPRWRPFIESGETARELAGNGPRSRRRNSPKA